MPDPVWMGLILLIALALRLYQLGEQSLWFDETHSWFQTTLPLRDCLKDIAPYPPLYYILMRPVALIGRSEFWLRFSSVATGVVGVAITYRAGRQLEGRRLGLLAALLCALNPFHLWYSQEFRYYALEYLLGTLSLYLFLRLLDGKRGWGIFALTSAAAYLTHYFTLLLPIAEFVYFVITLRRNYRLFRWWVVSQAAAGVLLGAWVLTWIGRDQLMLGIGWIPNPTAASPLLTLLNLGFLYNEAWSVSLVAGAVLGGVGLISGLLVKHRRLILFLWLMVPVLFTLLVYWLLNRSFYVDRFLIISLSPLLLLVAQGVLRLRPRWLQTGLAIGLVAISLVRVGHVYWDPTIARQDVQAAVRQIESNLQPGDRLVISSPDTIIKIYYHASNWSALDWTFVLSRPEADPWPSIGRGAKRLWLYIDNPHTPMHAPTFNDAFDPFREGEPSTVAWLAAHRQDVVGEWYFTGVAILLVELSP